MKTVFIATTNMKRMTFMSGTRGRMYNRDHAVGSSESVRALFPPSPFTTEHSSNDAREGQTEKFDKGALPTNALNQRLSLRHLQIIIEIIPTSLFENK